MVQDSMRAALRKVHNPPNPWHAATVEQLGPPPEAEVEIFVDATRAAIAKNSSPDIGFTYSVNPYRGCYHACAYCYARPSHELLDFGAGTDFDRRLVIKPKIAERLRAAFQARSWKGDLVVMSGNTDCYQPIEAKYELTRRCLEVCVAYRNPVGIVTKSALIERDIDLLAQLSREAFCQVAVSVPFDDAEQARAIEPGAPSPQRRYKTIQRLAEAGIPVGLMLAPIIPGLTDDQLPTILERARDAGASFVGTVLLRLPGAVLPVFERRLRALFPLRAERVLSQLRACRGGAMNDPRFGSRMRGSGARWEAIEALVAGTADRLGYGPALRPPVPSPFRRPERGPRQLALL